VTLEDAIAENERRRKLREMLAGMLSVQDDDGAIGSVGLTNAVLARTFDRTAWDDIHDNSPAAPRDVDGLQPEPATQLDPSRDEFGNRTFGLHTDPFPGRR
jgi:hypothetical protein